jgi:tRNA U34 5-carboxymethylaminomethyl modifying GTPase MnmE/TrmE
MLIWDILGQKGYSKIHESSFLGAHGTILVCDFTRRDTLESLKTYWIPLVRKMGPELPIVFVANKADLKERSQFSLGDMKSIAAAESSMSFKGSAKTGENVEEIFKAVGHEVIKSFVGPSTNVPLQIESPSETMTPVEVTDQIIDDFCRGYGGMEDGMPVIRTQFRRAGVDIKKPTKEGLIKVVEYLVEVEKEFKDEATVTSNLAKRRRWIAKIKA